METINEMDSWRSVIHFGSTSDKQKDALPVPVDMPARFYSYAVEWSPDSINCEWHEARAALCQPWAVDLFRRSSSYRFVSRGDWY